MYGFCFSQGYYWRVLGAGWYVIPNVAILPGEKWAIFKYVPRQDEEEDENDQSSGISA